MGCCQLPLWYYNFKKKFFMFLFFVYIIIAIIYGIYLDQLYSNPLKSSKPLQITMILLIFFAIIIVMIIFTIYKTKIKFSEFISTHLYYLNNGFIFILTVLTFILLFRILYIPVYILPPLIYMISIILLPPMYFESFDQNIEFVCAHNSFCCYPSKYNWVVEFFFRPQPSIFIKTCQKEFDRKIRKIPKVIKDIINKLIERVLPKTKKNLFQNDLYDNFFLI